MRTYICCAALGFALVASAPVANAQSPTMPPYETFIIQPSGTLITQMPVIAVPAGTRQPIEIVQTFETVRTISPAARPIVHHQIVAGRPLVHRVAAVTASRPLYNFAGSVPVATPVVQTIAPPPVVVPPAPGQVLNVSGQFRCVQGCAVGLAGTAFVTQNGWDLNLVNELGQPSKAWIDRPGHIWVQNWNEGAVYSPDGLTLQFDSGRVWQRVIPQSFIYFRS
jgi:hypothetical protein